MQPSTYVSSFYMYKLADALSAPYTSLNAYAAGAINSRGDIIKPESSIDAFEYMVIKLKKIFEELPYGMTKARLGNYMSTLQIFSEEFKKYDVTEDQFNGIVEGIISQKSNNEVSYFELLEDMGTGGGAGSLGVPNTSGNVNQGGISGFDVKLMQPLLRRKKPKYADDCEIFDVDSEDFNSFKSAKCWADIPDSENKKYIQRFQRRNKKAKVGVRGVNPLNGENELFWITYPAKNFLGESKGVEEFNDVASKILRPFSDERIKKIMTGSINQKDAEEYSRAAVFFSSLGNVTKKNSDEFLTRTAETASKNVSDTTEDGIGLDDSGKLFTYNGKNHRATFGTRGVERIGFPQKIVTDFYKLKQEKAETSSDRSARKISKAMSGLRREADVWAESPKRQRSIQNLMIGHLQDLDEPVAAVTPWDRPLLIPSKGIIRHVEKQPVRVVLGLQGEGGRPEPQAQLAGSELARSASGMERLRRNIGSNPRHIIPDASDIQVSKTVLSTEIQNKFRHLLGLK